VAARLPKKPGTQKLTPPSSAREAVDAIITEATASTPTKAAFAADRVFARGFIYSAPLPGCQSDLIPILPLPFACTVAGQGANANFVRVLLLRHAVMVTDATIWSHSGF
jgi:hypothetical protein